MPARGHPRKPAQTLEFSHARPGTAAALCIRRRNQSGRLQEPIMRTWSGVMPRWVDLLIAILFVLALVGFGVSLVVIYALDEYAVPAANESSVPLPRLY